MGSLYCDLSVTPWRWSSELLIQCTIQIQHNYGNRDRAGQIPPIASIGGIMVEPEGFVMMNVQVPCIKGYNEDQIAIVMEDPGLKDFQVILGTAMIYRVMEVIKESKISELAIPWASSRLSWLMRDVHA